MLTILPSLPGQRGTARVGDVQIPITVRSVETDRMGIIEIKMSSSGVPFKVLESKPPPPPPVELFEKGTLVMKMIVNCLGYITVISLALISGFIGGYQEGTKYTTQDMYEKAANSHHGLYELNQFTGKAEFKWHKITVLKADGTPKHTDEIRAVDGKMAQLMGSD